MPQIYVVLDRDGAFAAFWDQADDRTVRFFTPSGLWKKTFDAPWAEWDTIKQNVKEEDRRFPDIINFAWNCLGLKNMHIDKSSVKISRGTPGVYYPRLWRGVYRGPDVFARYDPINCSRTYGSAYVQSIVSAESLFSSLTELFRFIEPVDSNLDVFSHRIRELLILACTEVEASWRGFLDSNGYPRKPSYNTNDYVKLSKIFRLSEWQVGLSDYLDTSIMCPFGEWDVTQPTQSLHWYNGYNGVKHNRESEFKKASLRNLLGAMAALFVMQNAQWGPLIYDKMGYGRKSPFYLRLLPNFGPEDLYIPTLSGTPDFSPENYFSEPASDPHDTR